MATVAVPMGLFKEVVVDELHAEPNVPKTVFSKTVLSSRADSTVFESTVSGPLPRRFLGTGNGSVHGRPDACTADQQRARQTSRVHGRPAVCTADAAGDLGTFK